MRKNRNAQYFGFPSSLIPNFQFLARAPFFAPALQGVFDDLVFQFDAISGWKVSQAKGACRCGRGHLFHETPC
jgi:hypothetical protein